MIGASLSRYPIHFTKSQLRLHNYLAMLLFKVTKAFGPMGATPTPSKWWSEAESTALAMQQPTTLQ
jgi:hypothetical protein